MLKFVLLLILPCLIVADTQCSGGDISCPEDKTCCTVDGKPACCDREDLEANLPLRSVLQSAPNNITIQDGIFDCSTFTCSGTCCSGGCCPVSMATCCPNNKCCKFRESCCGTGCCAQMTTCCPNNGCCQFGHTCCGGGCCPIASKCCGSWCCKSSQRCGISYMTCFNAAAVLSPTTLVTLLAMWFAVYVVTKV